MIVPQYEYSCKACGHTFEVQQSIRDNPLEHCDACGKDEVVRLISVSSFRLNGGGWSRTGYNKLSDGLPQIGDDDDS